MILIVSTTREKAKVMHREFIRMLGELGGPYSIVDVSYTNLSVDTDDNLRFMFVDSEYASRFTRFNNHMDIFTDDGFFEDLEMYYYGSVYREPYQSPLYKIG